MRVTPHEVMPFRSAKVMNKAISLGLVSKEIDAWWGIRRASYRFGFPNTTHQ